MNLSSTVVGAIRSRFSGPRERGAALVEAAIAIPLLLLVIMGSVEFGFAWEAKSTSTSGVRSGVLRAASIADRPETDMRILQAIVGEVGAENADRIEWVAVFPANTGDNQAAIDACVNTGAGCVLYDNRRASDTAPPGFLTQIAETTDAAGFLATNFDDGSHVDAVTGDYNCDATKVDSNWCASGRFDNSNDIEIGVAIQYQHEWFTGIFPFGAPAYQDVSVTSTFLAEGQTITPSSGGVPGAIGQVYTNALSGPTLNGFSGVTGADLAQNPPGQPGIEFLGRFGSETITLTVDTPLPHTQVCITYELYLIGSVDDHPNWQDFFSLDVNTADNVVEIDRVSYGRRNELGNLGYGNWANQGYVVEISQCAPHTGSSVDIDFIAEMTNDDLNNESWAIGEVTVNVSN